MFHSFIPIGLIDIDVCPKYSFDSEKLMKSSSEIVDDGSIPGKRTGAAGLHPSYFWFVFRCYAFVLPINEANCVTTVETVILFCQHHS